MLNEEICRVRDKLNKSIEKNVDYSIIYKISVELDMLIAKYYNDKLIKEKSAKILHKSYIFFKKAKNIANKSYMLYNIFMN